MRITSAVIVGSAFCFAFLLTNVASAQTWRDAVLIRSAGDSLKGLVEFSDPDISTRQIRFRESRESSVVTYTTDQVTSFYFSNPYQRFDKLDARVTYYSRGVVAPGGNPIIGIKPIVVFAEVIRSGPTITLYSLFDEERKERFFVRKAGELTELINVSYQVDRESKTFTVKDERYRAQLRSLLEDCPSGQPQSYNYDGKTLGKAIDKYMICKGEVTAGGTGQKRRSDLLRFGLFGMLAAGSSGAEQWTLIPGGSMQVLSRKNRGNQFMWLSLGGPVSNDISEFPVYFSALAGTYMGSGKVQPLINAGVTSLLGTFTGGVGVAYNKRVILSGNYSRIFGTAHFAATLAVYPRLRRK
jgi:hypothetical protein